MENTVIIAARASNMLGLFHYFSRLPRIYKRVSIHASVSAVWTRLRWLGRGLTWGIGVGECCSDAEWGGVDRA